METLVVALLFVVWWLYRHARWLADENARLFAEAREAAVGEATQSHLASRLYLSLITCADEGDAGARKALAAHGDRLIEDDAAAAARRREREGR